ncbi:MAG TPA: hypothetical protein VF799_04405 [Geobacteraceae bacterium]
MAFCFGTLIFDRAGIVCGVCAFVVTAFVGTVACSVVQEHLARLRANSCDARRGSTAGRPTAAVSLP